ncbi:MAG: 4a-hydroxytetrahydrobiopterin dehydratase [Anaerolineae bacterium]
MTGTYSEAQIRERLAAHPGWELGEDGQVHRLFVFRDFKETMMFANAVALLAEAADHHPDLFIHGYKRLRVSLMSHDVQGITGRDFRLIEQIDALPSFKE